jgi:VanZ family protein
MRWLPFAAVLVLSGFLLFGPPGGEPPFEHADLLVHASLFGALALTGRLATDVAVRLAGGLIAYAALSELVQTVLPDRTGSLLDLAADLVGVVLGLVVAQAVSRARARSARAS